MKNYLEDPVLNLTGSALRVLRWLALAVVAMSIFAAVLGAFAMLITSGEVMDVSEIPQFIWMVSLGIVMFYLMAQFFKLLRSVILSVGEGQPLTMMNAQRLRLMGWLILGLQGVIFAATIALYAATEKSMFDVDWASMFDVDWAYSLIESVLIAAVLFILARVFEHGARVQEELEGTV